jgi:parvulin-like peptidyl-prolyl isomerase
MASIFSRPAGSASFRRFVPIVHAFLGAVLLLALASCHKAVTDPKDPQFIVASAKDWTITRAQLDNEVALFLRSQQKTAQDIGAKMPLLEDKILHIMVLKKLLLARAATLPLKDVDKDQDAMLAKIKSQFPTDAEFQAKIKEAGLTIDQLKEQIHEEILIRKTMEAEAFHDDQPTDQDINDFYLKNKDKFNQPTKIRASRVIVMVNDKTSPADKAAKKKAITKAHDRVVKGEDFSKVATEVSEDQYSAPKGGDIGYFQKGENEANFDDVAFATKQGEVSPVFETPMGYQFLKVTDIHPGGEVTIAQARGVIANHLLQEKQAAEQQAYTEKLMADSGVTFHLEAVDPTGTQAAPQSGEPVPSAPPASSDAGGNSTPPTH